MVKLLKEAKQLFFPMNSTKFPGGVISQRDPIRLFPLESYLQENRKNKSNMIPEYKENFKRAIAGVKRKSITGFC